MSEAAPRHDPNCDIHQTDTDVVAGIAWKPCNCGAEAASLTKTPIEPKQTRRELHNEAAPPRATISVREEVRADVVAHLKDMRRDQPSAHQIVYEEIIEVVMKAELHHVADFGRDY